MARCAAWLWLMATMALSSACRPVTILNSLSPSSHYTATANLRYGPDPRQRIDIFAPNERPDDAPLVVFFYGGGWNSGSKEDYEFVASSLTDAGFVVAIADYRLFPQVTFPTFVQDGARALVFAIERAPSFGADPSRVFVMGHSAGAHIAALLALDGRYLEQAGGDAGALAGLIGLSGPYDFLPIDSGYLLDAFPEATRGDSQPIRFASSRAPRTLLIHGGKDDVVSPGNSERLASQLREADVAVTLKVYAGLGHARTAAELAPPLDFIGSVMEECVTFIRGDTR